MTSFVAVMVVAQVTLTPITVHVRTVDQEALALPGIEVTAIEVSESGSCSCGQA